MFNKSPSSSVSNSSDDKPLSSHESQCLGIVTLPTTSLQTAVPLWYIQLRKSCWLNVWNFKALITRFFFFFFFNICFSSVFIPHGKTFDVHLDTSVPQEYCGKMWWSESSSLPLPLLQTLLYLTLWYDCWSPHKGVKTEKLVPFFCIWQDTIFGT